MIFILQNEFQASGLSERACLWLNQLKTCSEYSADERSRSARKVDFAAFCGWCWPKAGMIRIFGDAFEPYINKQRVWS